MDSLRISPDGGSLAASDRFEQIAIFNGAMPGSPSVLRPGTSLGSLSWAPESSALTFEGLHHDVNGVYVVGRDGSGLRLLVDDAGEPSWGPGIVHSTSGAVGDPGYRLLDPETGESEALTLGDDAMIRAPRWSPNGAALALERATTSPYGVTDLMVASPPFETTTPTLDDVSSGSWEWSPDGAEIAAWQVRVEDDELGRDDWVWDLVTVEVASGEQTTIASDLVRGRWAPDHIRWTPDGDRLVTSLPPHGGRLDERHDVADLHAISRSSGTVNPLGLTVPSTFSMSSLGGRFDVGYLDASWFENLRPAWDQGRLTAREVSGSELILEWPRARSGSGQVTYTVHRDGEVIADRVQEVSYRVRRLSPGTRYRFSVVAEDAAGNRSSALTATVTFSPAEPGGLRPPTCDDARPGVRFGDVDPRSVHGPNILCSAGLGLVEGRPDGSYDPTGTLTRAQTATVLLRALERSGLTLTAERSFRDVASDHPHGVAIRKLAAAGIINGVSQDRFDPAGRITRAQFASLLARTSERYLQAYPSARNPFTDIAGNVHEPAIRRLAGAGVVRGTSATTFEPGRDIDRAQAASLFVRWVEDQAGRMG